MTYNIICGYFNILYVKTLFNAVGHWLRAGADDSFEKIIPFPVASALISLLRSIDRQGNQAHVRPGLKVRFFASLLSHLRKCSSAFDFAENTSWPFQKYLPQGKGISVQNLFQII